MKSGVKSILFSFIFILVLLLFLVLNLSFKAVDQHGNETQLNNEIIKLFQTKSASVITANSQSITIDPRDMIVFHYLGQSTPAVVYDAGDPNNPYDDISNRRIGGGVLTNGWDPAIQLFEQYMSNGVNKFELDNPFGAHGFYLNQSGTIVSKESTHQLSGWTELNTIYRDYYLRTYGNEPPILVTFDHWKDFNEQYPNAVQIHIGSPHNDNELKNLTQELTQAGYSDPIMTQQYWDRLWSFINPMLEVGFRDFTFDASSGSGATHPATRRMIEVLSNPEMRDCNGLDQLLCGEEGSLNENEEVRVVIESRPIIQNKYQLQLDYWIREDTLQNYQNERRNPTDYPSRDQHVGTATRFTRFFDGTDDLYQQVSLILRDGDRALISSSGRNATNFTIMEEFISHLNISSIQKKIDLRSGNANEENMTYIITNPPNGGQLEVNPYYPYIYKFIPDANFTGIVSFCYKIANADRSLYSEEAMVTIEVKGKVTPSTAVAVPPPPCSSTAVAVPPLESAEGESVIDDSWPDILINPNIENIPSTNAGESEENFIFIQDYFPIEHNISMLIGDNRTFFFTPKANDYERIEWYLNNRLVEHDSLSYNLDSEELYSGYNKLEVVIIKGNFQESKIWNIELIDNYAELEYAFEFKNIILYVIIFTIISMIILLVFLIVNKRNRYY